MQSTDGQARRVSRQLKRLASHWWRRCAWSKDEDLNAIIWIMFASVMVPTLLTAALAGMPFSLFAGHVSLAFNLVLGMKVMYPEPCQRCGGR